MNQQTDAIQSPLAKASTALGAGAGTSYLTVSQQAASFWPTTFGEWTAAIASTAAAIYSIFLLSEWLWKKAIRPAFELWRAP